MTEYRTDEAVTYTVANVGYLGLWLGMQFEVTLWYGIPWISFYPDRCLLFYIPVKGMDFNLPQLFLAISILSTLTILLGMRLYLIGSLAKIRQLFAVILIAAFSIANSSFLVRSETDQYEYAIALFKHYSQESPPSDWWGWSPSAWDENRELILPKLAKSIKAYEDWQH